MLGKTVLYSFYLCSVLSLIDTLQQSHIDDGCVRYRAINENEYSEIMDRMKQKSLYIKTKNAIMLKVNNNYIFLAMDNYFCDDLQMKSEEAAEFLTQNTIFDVVNCFIVNIINAAITHYLNSGLDEKYLDKCRLQAFILKNSILNQNFYVNTPPIDLYASYMLVSEYFLLKFLSYDRLGAYDPKNIEQKYGHIYSEILEAINKLGQTYRWANPEVSYNIEECICKKPNGYCDKTICIETETKTHFSAKSEMCCNRKKGNVTVIFFFPSTGTTIENEKEKSEKIEYSSSHDGGDSRYTDSDYYPSESYGSDSTTEPPFANNNNIHDQTGHNANNDQNPTFNQSNVQQNTAPQNGHQNQTMQQSQGNLQNTVQIVNNPGTTSCRETGGHLHHSNVNGDTPTQLQQIHIHSNSSTRNVVMLPEANVNAQSTAYRDGIKTSRENQNLSNRGQTGGITTQKSTRDKSRTSNNVHFDLQMTPRSSFHTSSLGVPGSFDLSSSTIDSSSRFPNSSETSSSLTNNQPKEYRRDMMAKNKPYDRPGNTINSRNNFFIVEAGDKIKVDKALIRETKVNGQRHTYKLINGVPTITEYRPNIVRNSIKISSSDKQRPLSLKITNNDSETQSSSVVEKSDQTPEVRRRQKRSAESGVSVVNNNYIVGNKQDQAISTFNNHNFQPEAHQNVTGNTNEGFGEIPLDWNSNDSNRENPQQRNDNSETESNDGINIRNSKIKGNVSATKTTNIFTHNPHDLNNAMRSDSNEGQGAKSIFLDQSECSNPQTKVFVVQSDDIEEIDRGKNRPRSNIETIRDITINNTAQVSTNERRNEDILRANQGGAMGTTNKEVGSFEGELCPRMFPSKPKTSHITIKNQHENNPHIGKLGIQESPANVNNFKITLQNIGHKETETQKYSNYTEGAESPSFNGKTNKSPMVDKEDLDNDAHLGQRNFISSVPFPNITVTGISFVNDSHIEDNRTILKDRPASKSLDDTRECDENAKEKHDNSTAQSNQPCHVHDINISLDNSSKNYPPINHIENKNYLEEITNNPYQDLNDHENNVHDDNTSSSHNNSNQDEGSNHRKRRNVKQDQPLYEDEQITYNNNTNVTINAPPLTTTPNCGHNRDNDLDLKETNLDKSQKTPTTCENHTRLGDIKSNPNIKIHQHFEIKNPLDDIKDENTTKQDTNNDREESIKIPSGSSLIINNDNSEHRFDNHRNNINDSSSHNRLITDNPMEPTTSIQLNDNSVNLINFNSNNPTHNNEIDTSVNSKTTYTPSVVRNNDSNTTENNSVHNLQNTTNQEEQPNTDNNEKDKRVVITRPPQKPEVVKIEEKAIKKTGTIKKSKEKIKCRHCKKEKRDSREDCDCAVSVKVNTKQTNLLGENFSGCSEHVAHKSGNKVKTRNSYVKKNEGPKVKLRLPKELEETFSADSHLINSTSRISHKTSNHHKPRKVKFSGEKATDKDDSSSQERISEKSLNSISSVSSPEISSSGESQLFIDDDNLNQSHFKLTEDGGKNLDQTVFFGEECESSEVVNLQNLFSANNSSDDTTGSLDENVKNILNRSNRDQLVLTNTTLSDEEAKKVNTGHCDGNTGVVNHSSAVDEKL